MSDEKAEGLGLGEAAEALLEQAAEAELEAAAKRYAAQSTAARTRAEYAKQWRLFEAWCAGRGRCALPCTADTLIAWLVARAGVVRVSTISLGLAAIRRRHAEAGHVLPRSDPRVSAVWAGVRRAHGRAARRAAPLVAAEVRAVCGALPRTLVGARDRLVLTLGMAAALRRSELVGLDVEDLQLVEGGLRVTVRRSKTDQEAVGVTVGVARGAEASSCPVRALDAWLFMSGVTSGPLLRSVGSSGWVSERRMSPQTVGAIVKRAVRRVGLEATRYSGHSLRAGLATSAAAAGKGDRAIMAQGRWRGRSMVDRYVRDARLLAEDNASMGIGL